MKLIKESNDDLGVFDEIRDLREKLGDDLVLDEIIGELNYLRLEEFVRYMKRRYKKVLDEYEFKEIEEED